MVAKKSLWSERSGLMADDEVKALALSIFKGGQWQYVKPENVTFQCLSFALVDWSGYADVDLEQVGAVLGDADTLSPLSANGLPVYFGARIIHKDDWELIVAWLNSIKHAVEAL